MKYRVLLADDHSMMLEGLHSLLLKTIDIDVCGTASTGTDAIRLARELKPDIVVLDISLPDLNGIEVTRRILADNPDIRVIGLTMHTGRRFLIEMMQAGAQGYVVKNQPMDELLLAIRSVINNHPFVSSYFKNQPLPAFDAAQSSNADKTAPLSKRETEVLQLLAQGHSGREAADMLKMNVNTIEAHRHHIMEKLGLSNIADLTRYAIREGFIQVDYDTLSEREREIIRYIAEGKQNQAIAELLHISINTIATHRQNIMKKLRIHNTAELIHFAVREGMISPENG